VPVFQHGVFNENTTRVDEHEPVKRTRVVWDVVGRSEAVTGVVEALGSCGLERPARGVGVVGDVGGILIALYISFLSSTCERHAKPVRRLAWRNRVCVFRTRRYDIEILCGIVDRRISQQFLKAFIIGRRHGPLKKHTIPVSKALVNPLVGVFETL